MEREVLQTMIDGVPVGIATIGPDGRYRSVNPAFASMHGHRGPDDMVGRHARADLDPEVAAGQRSRILELWEGKQKLAHVDNRYSAPDGAVA